MTAIKESSDALNPTASIPETRVAPRKSRSAGDILALAIATCGVGYFPIAPGTLGSLVGMAIFLPLVSAVPRAVMGRGVLVIPLDTPWLTLRLLTILVVTLVGIWAASRVERLMQIKDPGKVVIDEVAGQMIALLSVPAFLPGWWAVISAFLLFRLFDIWKPYPIRQLEALESGLGIMADDLVAGVYALIVNSLLISVFLLFVARV